MAEQKTFAMRLVGVVHVLFVTVAMIHLVLVAAQPVLAGWSLDGDGLALDLHGINGSIIVTLSMILIPLSILWWRPGRGTFWAVMLSALLFAAETFQLGIGYADILIIHVPLGVGITLGSFVLVALILTHRRARTRVRSAVPCDAVTAADEAGTRVAALAGAGDMGSPTTHGQRADP